MPIPNDSFGTFHPSVYSHEASLLRWVVATPRSHSALRYQCPVTGSFVLVTDAATLRQLARPRARMRCADCGEMHLLMQDADAGEPSGFVAKPAKP